MSLTTDFNNISQQQREMTTDLLTLSLFSHRKQDTSRADLAKAAQSFGSQIEYSILNSDAPISINEENNINDTEEITVNGQRGIWLNKLESSNWQGQIPIWEYPVNQDEYPEIITKDTNSKVEYIQELAIRYLRPPSPVPAGDIIITEEDHIVPTPAPPLILRQQPARPATPEPLIIRELPPKAPSPVGIRHITVSGKKLPPPPRKVVIERLAPLPNKPQPVIIERWLPYKPQKRRVVYEKNSQIEPAFNKPKNIIIQWEPPKVQVKQEIKYLGVINANPIEYCQRYCAEIITKQPTCDELNNEINFYSKHTEYEKENFCETSALKTQKMRVEDSFKQNVLNVAYQDQMFFRKIFTTIDKDSTGEITVNEAESVFERISKSLNQSSNEKIKAVFEKVDGNSDGLINFDEFQFAVKLFFA